MQLLGPPEYYTWPVGLPGDLTLHLWCPEALPEITSSLLNALPCFVRPLPKNINQRALPSEISLQMSHILRKPVYAMCEQQRRRSVCASTQSNQRLCCSLPRQYHISSFYIRNFKPLASFGGCAGRFESYLVENPEDRFSRDEAQM